MATQGKWLGSTSGAWFGALATGPLGSMAALLAGVSSLTATASASAQLSGGLSGAGDLTASLNAVANMTANLAGAGVAAADLTQVAGAIPTDITAMLYGQGVLVVTMPPPVITYQWDTSQGKAPRAATKDYLAENLNRMREQRKARDVPAPEDYNLARLHADDQAAAEFIMALVHSEILYGSVH